MLLFLLLLAACEPRPIRMSHAPAGEPMYVAGWKDGCRSGLAAVSNTYYKVFYRFTQNAYYVTNQLYFGAWLDAYTYCRDYGNRWTFDPIDTAENIEPANDDMEGLGDLFKGDMFKEANDPYITRDGHLPFSF